MSENPADITPHIILPASGSENVYAFEQIGDTMYAGGRFTEVQDPFMMTTYSRSNFVAFDAETGVISSFDLSFNGLVTGIQASDDGSALYISGAFSQVNGVTRRGIMKYDLVNNQIDPTFAPTGMRTVSAIEIVNGYLIAAGNFDKHLMAMDLTTGADLGYIDVEFSGVVDTTDETRVRRLAVSPDGTKLVGTGNFASVNGQPQRMAFMLNLGTPATLSNWYAPRFDVDCPANNRLPAQGVDFAPDGSYFVIVTTGGRNNNGLCDAAARFETANQSDDVEPTWINWTGGDTLYSVAITGPAVYVGGHQRWLDNPDGNDSAGPGAVSRPGIGAIDPVSGMALPWNPTKSRNHGTMVLVPTPDGLWVGSDGENFGQETHVGIGFVPLDLSPPPPDTTRPNTFIDSGPSGPVSGTSATFTFSATEPATFQCSLDNAPFEACTSPMTYENLATGSHDFQVVAVDSIYNVDASPPQRSWTIVDEGTELIGNPGFEVNTSGWKDSNSASTLTRVSGGHSGGWAAEVSNDTAGGKCGMEDSPNWVGYAETGSYTASIWVRSDTPGETVRLRVREYLDGLQGSVTESTVLTSSWQQLTAEYMPVALGSTLDLEVYTSNSPAGVCFQADDASMTYVSGPPPIEISESGDSTDVSEDGTTDSYTVVLHSVPTADVNVTVTPDGQTDLGSGAGTAIVLTFTPANAHVPQVVNVAAVEDAVFEGLHTSTITHVASSADPFFDGLPIANVVANITDNDTAGVTIIQSGGSTDVTEGGAADSYTVVLDSVPTANVNLTVTPDSQTDLGGGAGTAIVLTFTPANALDAQLINVTAVNDFFDEGPHFSTITHVTSSADPFYNGIPISNIVANITDNDTAGVSIGHSGGSTDVSEDGLTDSYSVVLDSQPTANVMVDVQPDGQTTISTGGPVNETILDADFDADEDGFGYFDDTFRGTNSPGYASGTRLPSGGVSGGSMQVTLGNVNSDDILGMSGGWQRSFTLSELTEVTFSFDYNLTQAANYESDEFSQALVSLDGVLYGTGPNDYIAQLVGDGNGGSDHTTGWQTFQFTPGILAAGTHTLTIGAYNNKKTYVDESAELLIDNVLGTAESSSALLFNPSNWNVPQTVTVAAVDDAVAEGSHTSTIAHTLSSPDANFDGLTVESVVHITDNELSVNILQSGGTTDVTEGGTVDSYTVVLNGVPTADVIVTVTPDNQTDLGSGVGTAIVLTFTPANALIPQVVNVTAVDDSVVEGTHTSTLTHTASSADPSFDGLSISNVVASITDNDTAGATINQSGGSTEVTEGGAADSYTVVLDSIPAADVTVTVAPDGQTDLGSGAGTAVVLTFTPANALTPQVINVTAVEDSVLEGLHASTITHSASSADPFWDGFPVGNVVVNITDNDTAGVTVSQSGGSTDVTEGGAADSYTVVLDSIPTADVTVTVAPDSQTDLGGGAGAAIVLTFTPANALTPQVVSVTAVNDAIIEGSHSSEITHTSSSAHPSWDGLPIDNIVANITDDDAAGVTISHSGGSTDVTEGGAGDSYTVVLDSVPASDVIVTVTPDNQTDLGSGAGTAIVLTFTPGSAQVPQLVHVTAVDDALIEGLHSSTITHATSSADLDYDALPINNLVADITDNDSAGVTIDHSGGSTDVTEGGAGDSYTVVLSAIPTSDVIVTVTPDNQTDLGNGAGAAIVLTFTPANGLTPQVVSVTAVDDVLLEGPHTSTITHSASSTDLNYDGLAINNVVANITDNDTPGVTISQSGGSTDVTEGGAADSYTVVLNAVPTADVNLTVTPDSQTDLGSGAGTPIVLTFTPANALTPQLVNVGAFDDGIIEGQHSSTVTHAASSADPNYDGLPIGNVMINITDNDAAGASIGHSGGSTDVTEGGATDSYTVVLDAQPTADVRVDVQPDGQTTISTGGPVTETILAADFDTDEDGFGYLDDSFRGTNAPGYAAGARLPSSGASGGGLQVTLGGIDSNDILGMSGGWQRSFTLSEPTEVTFSFEYNLTQAADYESDELSQALVSLDGALYGSGPNDYIAQLVGDGNGGVAQTTGWQTFQFTPGTLSAGVHTMTIGAYNNKKTYVDESTELLIDNVLATAESSSALLFTPANWNVPQTITVAAVDDAVPEGLHTSTITHMLSSLDSSFDGLTVESVANITDNELSVSISQSGGSTDVAEGGATDTYTAVLNGVPTDDVVITVTPDSQTDLGSGAGAAIVLTFTPANALTPQVVNVTAVDDAAVEGPHTSTIMHAASSADPDFNGLPISNVVANITDNDSVSQSFLYFTYNSAATLPGGLAVDNEDIVAFDGTDYSMVLDGSDLGLASLTIDAIDFIDSDEILISFTSSASSLPGITGTVDDSDIVRFTATQLGETTAGTFELFFDASDVGLEASTEDIEAIELLDDGRLLVSTKGDFSVPGLTGQEEDIIAFTPTSLGDTTAGSWSLYFDGNDVSLTGAGLDGMTVGDDGEIYISTGSSYSVPGLAAGKDEDVLIFRPTALGENTAGTYDPTLLFDGSVEGLGGDLKAIDVSTITTSTLDANGDGGVSAVDALVIINFLSSEGQGEGETLAKRQQMRQYDSNGDGRVSVLDALQVVNYLSRSPATAAPEQVVAPALDEVNRGSADTLDDDLLRILADDQVRANQ